MAKSSPSPPNSLEAKLEFVEEDKVRLSYACIICGNPLRLPILQLYCGHRGCGACVEHLRHSEDKSCPGGESECKDVDVSVQGRYSVLICDSFALNYNCITIKRGIIVIKSILYKIVMHGDHQI